MAFLSRLDISVSGMIAQRVRSEVITQNIANAGTTRTSEGTPYVRQVTLFSENLPYKNIDTTKRRAFGEVLNLTLEERRERKLAGVRAIQIAEDPTPATPVYDPSHPHADEDGYYYMPNVDVAEEEIDLMAATRSYEANLNAYNAMLEMTKKALTIGKG